MRRTRGSQLPSGLRLLLGRHGMAKFFVGWLYVLSLFYVVTSQLRISSVASTRMVSSNPGSTGRVHDRNSTFAIASLLSRLGITSFMAELFEASTSMLRMAARVGNEDASRLLRIPTSTYYLNKTSQNASLENRSEESFSYNASWVPPSSTVTSIKHDATNASYDNISWSPLNWSSLPTPSHGSRRPIMYLHAGPYKTASSFLQCVLSRNAYEYLRMDGIAYLGTCSYQCKRPASSYDFCLTHSSESFFTTDGEIKPQLRKKLQALFNARQSALMVWEYFSDLPEHRLLKLHQALKDWEIHVILSYRRLFEWLPSWYVKEHASWPLVLQFATDASLTSRKQRATRYSQKHRPMPGRDHYDAWPGQTIASGDRLLPSTGSERFPFDMYSADVRKNMPFDGKYLQTMDLLEKTKLHPVEHARKHWLRYADNVTVTVLSLHHLPKPDDNSDPLLTYMFCNLIPLDNTCRAVRNNSLEILDVGSNARFPENYDMLALHAHRHGLHPNGDATLQRTAVWNIIQEHQESHLKKTSRDFPLRCISNASLDILWKLSVEAERTIFTGLEAEHRSDFDRAVQRKAFCFADVDRVLQHDDWRRFFQPTAHVLPHITERRRGGVWWPSWDTQFSIEQLFFSNVASRIYKARNAPNSRSVDVFGFVYVGQTDMARLTDLVRNISLLGNIDQPIEAELEDPLLGCLFAKSFTGAMFAAGWRRRCPLSQYSSVVEVWAKNLNYLATTASALDTAANSSVGQNFTSRHSSIVPVLLIRDPLDRWVEMYQNWKSTNGTSIDNLSIPPSQTQLNGSLEEFLRLVSSLPYHNRTIGFLHQYQHVAVDVKRAIDLVAGSTPRVLPLIQECWDESLQLLAIRASFPALDDSTANPSIEANHLRRYEAIDEASTQTAQQWLANDYEFYDAAIAQFLRFLTASNATASLADSCSRKLSQLGHSEFGAHEILKSQDSC